MCDLGSSHIEAEVAVGGGLPSILIHAGCGTGSGGGRSLGIVCGGQLGQCHCGSLGALGASTGQGTGCGCGGILCRLVNKIVGFRLAITTGARGFVVGSIGLGISPSMCCCSISRSNGGIGSDVGQRLVPTLEGIVIGGITRLGGG